MTPTQQPVKTVPLNDSSLVFRDGATGAVVQRRYRAEVVAGPSTGLRLPLEGTVLVGSSPQAQLSLQDETVSTQHLELQVRAEGIRIRDLKSTNGTFVGGARVDEFWVMETSTIRVGRSSVRIFVEQQAIDTPPYESAEFGGVIGTTQPMQDVFSILRQVSPTSSTVVLLGDTGSGKEVVARAIHAASNRRNGPFEVLDCGAVAANLIESELFGHLKGAYTGADVPREGAFARAHGGTLFLDEIAELPLDFQPKLLRVLETRTIKAVGSDQSRTVDVRIIAATHRDLETEVKEGRLRRDLFFRLAVVPVRLPSLKERRDDIPRLVQHFLNELGHPEFEVSAELMARLKSHDWPGNVRELRNVVERALLGNVDPLASMAGAPGGVDLTRMPFKAAKEQLVESFTREYVQALLKRCDGNISEVARTAGIARNWVHHLVTKYQLK